jgi:hypothetical protein
MPDFTEEVHFHCASVEDYETEVEGSGGRSYKVRVGYVHGGPVKFDWSCECQGFKFRKRCKHIDQAKASPDYCGWHQMIEGGDIVRDENNVACCPKCGNIAIALRYAV